MFDQHPSVTLLPVTNELRGTSLFRIGLEPTADSGLGAPSQIMVDKIQTVSRELGGRAFGRVDDETLVAAHRALAVFLGLA